MIKEDITALSRNEGLFYDGSLDVSNSCKKAFCKYAPKEHQCQYCPLKTKEDEDSSSTHSEPLSQKTKESDTSM